MVWLPRVTIICLFTLQNLYADGKYFPEKAYKKPPDLPSQRAILVYRNGVEKLTIESALNGQGQEFGWIIPLPSKPSHFEKAAPGLIKTLSSTLQPEIIHDTKRMIGPFFGITVVITMFCLMTITKVPSKRLNRLLLLLLTTFIFSCLFMPHLGVVRNAGLTKDVMGVEVHDIQQIGSYQLSILEADNAGALDKWLMDNGFAGLTDKDKPVISDYIKEGWFFVTARLRREGEGYSRPHPLTMSFASKIPIYPIRLTSTLGGDLYLELFVIAQRRAKCEELTLEVCDRYNFRSDSREDYYIIDPIPGFVGDSYKQNIGHSDANEQMWDGCFVSKLAGILTNDDMAQDIVLELEQAKPYRKNFYSRAGARGTGFIASLCVWSLLLVILTIDFGHKGKMGDKWKALFKITVITLLVSLPAGGLTYAVLPKIEVQTDGSIHPFTARRLLFGQGHEISEKCDYFKNLSLDEANPLVDDYFISKNIENIYTGEKIKRENSPGNYTVFEDERGIILRKYFEGGYPHDFILTSEKQD